MIKQTSTIELARGHPVEKSPGAGRAFNDNPNGLERQVRESRLSTYCRKASRLIPAVLLAATLILALPASSYGHVSIGIAITTVEPPPLVVYDQPLCPGPNFIWTPGYWSWGPDGYFWVPGTWVMAPYPGELWTPGYWSWDDDDDAYFWTPGYWGPEVGFYGGIVYGYGYYGSGYQGGYWRGGTFLYNTAANNVDRTTITNVYNRTVINNTTVTNVSFNGGRGGTTARPTPTELAAAKMRHDPPAPAQREQEQIARTNRAQFASVNHGRPEIAATAKPTAFSGPGVVRAKASRQPAVAMNRSDANRVNPRNRKSAGAVTPPPATPTRPNAMPVPNSRPNARPNAHPSHEVPANGSKPEPQPKRRLPENRPETQPVPQPEPHVAPPKRPAHPHAQNIPHPAEQQRRVNPPHRQAPPHPELARNPSPTRPVAMQRSAPPQETSSRRVVTPPRGMPPQRNTAPPRSSPPSVAQHRDTPHRPKGGR